jgi:hypothetical protein
MTKIPKIVWTLWINFDDPENGILEPKTQKYLNRMKQVLDNYKVICITSVSQLITLINGCRKTNNVVDKNVDKYAKKIIEIVKCDYIKPAHKSDVVRYFLLYSIGGVWIDLTTIVINNIDDLIDEHELVIPYVSTETAFRLFFNYDDNPVIHSHDGTKTKKLSENYLDTMTITAKYDVMPENYFIASVSKQKNIKNILSGLIKIWFKNGKLPQNEQESQNILICYMYKNVYGKNKLFTDETYNYTYKTNDIDNFKSIWIDPSYVFNYVQLYN